MIGYNVLCFIGTIIISCYLGGNLGTTATYYALLFVGFLPTYWACERLLKELWAIILANLIIFIGIVHNLGLYSETHGAGLAGRANYRESIPWLELVNCNGYVLNLNLIVMFMWLGLFLFSIWCGRGEIKQ